MDCSLPGSSVHVIFRARALEWVAISFSRESSRPRDRTQVSSIADRHFTVWTTKEAPICRGATNKPEGRNGDPVQPKKKRPKLNVPKSGKPWKVQKKWKSKAWNLMSRYHLPNCVLEELQEQCSNPTPQASWHSEVTDGLLITAL